MPAAGINMNTELGSGRWAVGDGSWGVVLTAQHNYNQSEQEQPGHAVALGHMEWRHGDSGDRNNNRKCSKPSLGPWYSVSGG